MGLIFVSSRQFEALKTAGSGTYMQGSYGDDMLVFGENIVKVFDPPEPEEPNGEPEQPPAE